MEYIARCPVDGVNYSSISSNLCVTKYKAQKYLDYLERSFVVTLVFPAGTNVLKEPKVLLQLPYRLVYEPCPRAVGALREEFFAIALRQHGVAFSYAKSTRGGKTPDYAIDLDGTRAVVETGGQGKGRSKFKGLEYDRKVVLTDGGGRPSPASARRSTASGSHELSGRLGTPSSQPRIGFPWRQARLSGAPSSALITFVSSVTSGGSPSRMVFQSMSRLISKYACTSRWRMPMILDHGIPAICARPASLTDALLPR